MRVYVEPSILRWSALGDAPVAGPGARRELAALARRSHERLGAAALSPDRRTPILATGHQAWLWHPGILAKDAALSVAAQRAGSGSGESGAEALGSEGRGMAILHVVVDHDPSEALRLDVPVRDGEALGVHTVQLGRYDPLLPPCLQPPEAVDRVMALLDELDARSLVSVAALRDVFASLRDGPPPENLAEQVTQVTLELMRPIVGRVAVVMSSELLGTSAGRALVARLRDDAAAAVRAYNQAATSPAGEAAGMAPLRVEGERVELPLWELRHDHGGDPNQARGRVFADLADATPILVREDGSPIPFPESSPAPNTSGGWLAPRALLLTGLLRSAFCDLFVHGTGGGAYDRVTEAWWLQWTGQTLAPMAVATADLCLDLGRDVPVAQAGDVAQAVWYAHHLPHNVDRMLGLLPEDALVREKRSLLAHLNGDRAPRPRPRPRNRNRARAFQRLHAINAALANAHAPAVVASREAVKNARAGLRNRAVARKRDWCLGLYPRDQLLALRGSLEKQFGSGFRSDACGE